MVVTGSTSVYKVWHKLVSEGRKHIPVCIPDDVAAIDAMAQWKRAKSS